MGLFGMSGMGVAAPIGTDTLLRVEERGELMSRIRARTQQKEVREQLIDRGVSPEEVDARISALSTEELRTLSSNLDELPAGGNILGLIGAVFVVLLILELLGVTNVFTKV